jgi:hypothetical protein
MKRWQDPLHFDPISPLISSENQAIEYFTKRDLLDQDVPPIDCIWQLPGVQKILQKQQSDGSWKYPGTQKVVYPRYHYSLFETYKTLRLLVKRYSFTIKHPATKRAAEFIFSCQAADGDIRGFVGNQYATYYTGDAIAVLISAGYENDRRIEKGFRWLLSMRQDDGGWTIPILTHKFDGKTKYRLTSQYAPPVEPDRSKPFSHNWTNMVLRAFAAHPQYRHSEEARIAAELMKSRFFEPDFYSSYRSADYWVRFAFWWPNLLTALDSLTLMGYSADDPDLRRALGWFIDHQQPNGLWKTTYAKGKIEFENEKNLEERRWVSLAICRILKICCSMPARISTWGS